MAEETGATDITTEGAVSPSTTSEPEVSTGLGTDSNGDPMPLMSRSQKLLVVSYSVAFLVIPVGYFIHSLGGNLPELEGGANQGQLLFLCALLGGAMGSVHSLASIAVHAGKGNLGARWVIFYLCRPFTGVGIALVTCLVLMSGIAGFKVDESDPTPLLAWSALAGLYSQPALEKLRELFDTLFRTKKQDEEEEKEKARDARAKS